MHEVLVNRLGGLSLPRKSVVRLIDRPDMTLDVYRGRKTTIQQHTHFDLIPFLIADVAIQKLVIRLCAQLNMHNSSHITPYKTGPGCSKLTTSLVNVSLNFQKLISQICLSFLLKKC